MAAQRHRHRGRDELSYVLAPDGARDNGASFDVDRVEFGGQHHERRGDAHGE